MVMDQDFAGTAGIAIRRVNRSNVGLFLNAGTRLWIIAALFVLVGSARTSYAQIRPTVVDQGDVKQTTQKVSFDRSHIGSTRSTKASYSILVVLTDPKDAEIQIDNKPVGKATDGRFKRELPSGRRYSLLVTAGAEYVPFKQVVQLKAGEPEIVEAGLSSKFGTIKIFPAMDGVNLLMDGQPIPKEDIEVDKAEKVITINQVSAADHKISYDLPGYALYEHSFNVEAGTTQTWNFIPEKAVSEILVATEPGTAVYLDGQQKGTTPEDGKLNIPGINIGEHQVKLVKDGYEELSKTITLAFHQPVALAERLTPLPTSAEFSDNFDFPTPGKWTMPASGWSISNGRLVIQASPTPGYATKILYRAFVMSFDLKLISADGAAWIVRMKDPSNYYLFYLSGPKGLFPNSFVTYVVRNNNFDPHTPVNISPVVTNITAGGEYNIEISADKNVINTFVTPAATGARIPLGSFTDPDNAFPYGGIGFRTVAGEKFSIDDLYIQPH